MGARSWTGWPRRVPRPLPWAARNGWPGIVPPASWTRAARVARLFDPGTFVELGGPGRERSLKQGAPHAPADALVGGLGAIDGRPAIGAAEDFTVLGGSIGTGASDKRLSTRATCRPGEGPARLHARGRRASRRQRPGRASAQRPAGPRRSLGSRADGVPGARGVGRARGAHGAAVRLRRDDTGRLLVHRRPAAGQGGSGRGRHEGGVGRPERPRRTVRRCPQPCPRRPGGNRQRPGGISRICRSTPGRRRPSWRLATPTVEISMQSSM